jgi:hypothetical protein
VGRVLLGPRATVISTANEEEKEEQFPSTQDQPVPLDVDALARCIADNGSNSSGARDKSWLAVASQRLRVLGCFVGLDCDEGQQPRRKLRFRVTEAAAEPRLLALLLPLYSTGQNSCQ